MDQVNQILSGEMIASVNISFRSTLLAFLSSIICSWLIKIFYTRYGMAMNNRDYFSTVFILLAITTVSVITIVKYSLALSLGLVGALSIVRFRAAIKEPEELIYLFLIIAIGLAFGSNQFLIGYLLTSVALSVIYVLSKIRLRQDIISVNNLVVVVSGPRKKIRSFNEDHLNDNKADHEFIIREIVNENNTGRVVFETSVNIKDEKLKLLMDSAENNGLDINIITGVGVPA